MCFRIKKLLKSVCALSAQFGNVKKQARGALSQTAELYFQPSERKNRVEKSVPRCPFDRKGKGSRQKNEHFAVRLAVRGGMHVKIARDKSARRTNSYVGSILIQYRYSSWPFNVYWSYKVHFHFIQSSLTQKHSFGKIDNCTKKCTAYELERRYSLILCKALS